MGTSRAVVSRPRVVLPGPAPKVALRVVLGAALALTACERDTDGIAERAFDVGTPRPDAPDVASGPAPSPAGEPVGSVDGPPDGAPDDDAPPRRLELRLATEVTDAFDHDSWVCTGEASSIEYRLAVDADGARLGTELDGRGAVTDVTFGWAAIAADIVLFDYADVGRQVELGSILFAGDDAFRANDGVDGPLECRRQRYVDGMPTRDVAVTAAGDVDRDVEAAAALAERIETPRVDGGAFAHWHCEVADGPATGYVFAGAGVLDPEPRAVLFAAADDAVNGGNDGGLADGARAPVDESALAGGRRFSWFAADGTTLLLVPLDVDLASPDGGPATDSLADIVFPVDDAFTARRTDGALLQCLRDGDP